MRDLARPMGRADGDGPLVEAVLAELRDNGVSIGPHGAVVAYLEAHSDLMDELRDLVSATRHRLGSTARLSLELVRDPEVADEYLALFARQCDYDPDLLDTLDRIAAEHAVERSTASGWLTLTTDFQPPR